MTPNMQTMDGNKAAAHIAYAFSDVAAIYPITPSSPMGEYVDAWAAQGRRNLFGQVLKVAEMQSEGGAAGAVHGSLAAGGFTTTFTASQGLLLMVPNMYKIAGELMPAVFHVAARALAGQALSIFGDHQDVMAVRSTGWSQLCASSVQEVMDMSLVSHLATLEASVPFINFFDGFRTSHEFSKIDVIDYEAIRPYLNMEAIQRHRDRALNPEHPHLRGSAQNPDVYFQTNESSNKYYLAVPEIVQAKMDIVAKITGRQYHLFDYHGDPEAERVIIIMGSGGDAVIETVDYLMAKGEKVGVLKVRLFRPFSADHLIAALPKTVSQISVMDRTKENGAQGEPLYLEVCTAVLNSGLDARVVGGRYGLGSKEFNPTMVKTIYDNMAQEDPKNGFTVGIIDDVTHLSLPAGERIDAAPAGTIAAQFWGLGGDGTVGANQDAIKIIGDNTQKFAQAYFAYDSKKSGGVTVSHLRFGDRPITSSYLIENADYVAVHNPSYMSKYDVLEAIKPGAILVLNSNWDLQGLDRELPGHIKRKICELKLRFYSIDAMSISQEVGLGTRINMVMQTVFFQLAEVLPVDDALRLLKEAIQKTYAKKGDEVVSKNWNAVDRTLERLWRIDYPQSWAQAADEPPKPRVAGKPDFIHDYVDPVSARLGEQMKVSEMTEGGIFPLATSKWEKRGVAYMVPEWYMDKCTQCNQCSFVCPHAAIKPYLVTEAEALQAPHGYQGLEAKGKDLEGMQFRIQVNSLDCMGCGICVEACPTDALAMQLLETQRESQVPLFDYMESMPIRDGGMDKYKLKGSQFRKPLLEFSGACSGCGETPYMKTITQLYGDRMIIANATGCSSIWGGSSPSIPWAVNDAGHGPAWANSLFEDNAEYGFGMMLATTQRRASLKGKVERALDSGIDTDLAAVFQHWLDAYMDGDKSKELSLKIHELLKGRQLDGILGDIWASRDLLTRPSHWIVGGDGWAYDIGYGGLDHVLAMGEDVNVLVYDTEVYSNTGGQSSKATPIGSVAKFAASGKKTVKKDLGMMAMSYGYVYVASVAMGANAGQFMKAIKEAESYPGPSMVIAYSPCIAHGLKKGMGNTMAEEAAAVKSGYWFLYRYDPRLNEPGQNPFQLDSREPKADLNEFLMGEVRYERLTREFPEEAERLHAALAVDLKGKYARYKQMAEVTDA